jgi:hypothetical protein
MQNKYFKDNSNYKRTDIKSSKIIEGIKQKIFKKIFSYLDYEETGIINGQTVDINSLPEKIRSIINPLIKELKEQNETLSDEEFSMACDHLFTVNFY